MQDFTRLALSAALIAVAAGVQAAPITTQGTWWGTDGTDGTLRARDINGDAVALSSASATFFYDTTLNITWLANMNAGAGSTFDDGFSATDGRMTWDSAVAWTASLTTGGFSDWRLPSIIDSGAPGCQFSYSGTDCGYNVQTQVGGAYSEWAHLFYVTLGNLAEFDSSGNYRVGSEGVDWGLTNTAYFTNMQSDFYWSGTELAPDPANAWFFGTFDGFQGFVPKSFGLYAVAVRSGDVLRDGGTVPEPQSLALALTALAGLGLALRRRRAA